MPQVKATAYEPVVLVDTKDLPETEWLEWRRKGIGGSDAAAILGISPFRTARDLYYDKLGVVAVVDDDSNWVAMKMGHLLEDLVAEIFAHRTGFRIYQIKKMFRHPLHPYMLADVDYFVELPGGRTAILEIKTTNYNATGNWWRDGQEVVPPYYESQGRHYMAVMNVDECYFCCLYGNNEEETIIRHITRDMAYEEELVALESYFWNDYVLTRVPPPYTENGDLIVASSKRYTKLGDPADPIVELSGSLSAQIARYLALQKQKKTAEGGVKELEEEIKRQRALIVAAMGPTCAARCEVKGVGYMVTSNPVRKKEITKANLLRLEMQMPEVYEAYVTTSEYRKLVVKEIKESAA